MGTLVGRLVHKQGGQAKLMGTLVGWLVHKQGGQASLGAEERR